MATPKTVLLKGRGIRKEGTANAAITPGHLVERMSTGNIRVHATAGAKASPIFAVENEILGKEITVAYAATDRCYFEFLTSGCEVYALVAAAAPAIVVGDLLESAGDGTLRKVAATTDLTDSTTGTADGTLADVGGAFSQATLNNNFADLAAKVNAILPGASQAHVVARALEAVDNSGGGSAVRIKVEVV